MLLFYLCDIVRKDVIRLLRPLVLYLKAKADNSNKRLSLSGLLSEPQELSWPLFARGFRGGGWAWYWPTLASHLTLRFWSRLISWGSGKLFFFFFFFSALKTKFSVKWQKWCLIFNNCMYFVEVLEYPLLVLKKKRGCYYFQLALRIF